MCLTSKPVKSPSEVKLKLGTCLTALLDQRQLGVCWTDLFSPYGASSSPSSLLGATSLVLVPLHFPRCHTRFVVTEKQKTSWKIRR